MPHIHGKQTGKIINSHILEMLKLHKIDIKNCHAQACHGPSAMASEAKEKFAVINGLQPMADSIHCQNHCINLAIANTCKNEIMSKFINGLTSVSYCLSFPTHLKGSISLSGSSIIIKVCQFQNQIENML